MAEGNREPGEHHHRRVQGGGARAAVFGVSDGLVTNVSLILGVAGAHPGGDVVRLTGFAGMVAGAFSMAAGEYVSMQAQRELLLRELEVERVALHESPESERRELTAIYEGRGVEPELAEELAGEMMRDPQTALETHAREELGIDPTQLGSPYVAASLSLLMFAVGAFLPLVPWLFRSGSGAVLASVAIGVVAAVVVGAGIGFFTGRSAVRSAVRQLAVAAVAASVTYGVGRLVGVSGA
jgi:VIT1/CCC1 family predicted Fe2+/Mn2+ transporter